MPDFDIPDGPADETYDQEFARVRAYIPPVLVPLWESIVLPDDAPEAGWPEMVAQFLQLSPTRVQACLGAMAMIHLVRSGGSMMKMHSSTISLSMARGEPGMTILAKAYAAAKMTAILASGDLRKNESILPAVSRLMTLIEKAHDASAQLSSDASSTPREPHANVLRTIARELNAAASAVEADVGGEPAPPIPPGSSVPPEQAQALLTVEVSRVMRSYVAAVDARTAKTDMMPSASTYSPPGNTFGSLDFPDGFHVCYATGDLVPSFKRFQADLAVKVKADGRTIDAVSTLIGHSAAVVESLIESAKEAAHALADASIATPDAENALKWGGLSVELARALAPAEELVK